MIARGGFRGLNVTGGEMPGFVGMRVRSAACEPPFAEEGPVGPVMRRFAGEAF